MYDTHVPLLAQHGQTPEGFADLVTFAIVTQNQHFNQVCSIMDRIRQEGLAAETRLSACQKRGIIFAKQHASQYLPRSGSVHDAMQLLVELPSIGIIKAGFIAQMLGYDVGCLDTHNCRALGLSRKTFHRVPAKAETLTSRISVYITACASLGTPQALWDGWCRLIALRYPRYFMTAEDVSAYHVRCVRGDMRAYADRSNHRLQSWLSVSHAQCESL